MGNDDLILKTAWPMIHTPNRLAPVAVAISGDYAALHPIVQKKNYSHGVAVRSRWACGWGEVEGLVPTLGYIR